jgi:hypothetical protein
MRQSRVLRLLTSFVVLLSISTITRPAYLQAQATQTAQPKKPAELQIPGAPFPMRVLMQSPAETDTEFQVICLFESTADNPLRGALLEINEKLRGLLDQMRKPTLFRGELGETILMVPPVGTLPAKKFMLIGLGDSQTFTPQRMELIGSIVYGESNRMGIAHPSFAPTILDGGVTKFATGQISEEFVAGFLRAARVEAVLGGAGASEASAVQDLTYLAGPSHAADTKQGMEKALNSASK